MEEYFAWLELQGITDEERQERKAFEDTLRRTIKNGDIDEIRDKLTPRALTKCSKNALFMAMETNFELRRLADKKGPDEEDLTKLASTLDEFIFRLFDPLRSGGRIRDVFLKAAVDDVMDAAIELKQKNFFAHPVINSLMSQKWYGELGGMRKSSWLTMERWAWGFLNVWCLFDVILFPVIFFVLGAYHFARKKFRNRKGTYINKSDVYVSYQKYFTTPYFIFVRDTVSLLAHLALHYAVCLAPSSIPFSVLEWAIWLFYMGRIAMESKQFSDIKVQRITEVEVPTLEEPVDYIEVTCEPQDSGIHAWKRSSIGKKFMKYLSDQWNILDLMTVVIYIAIFVLRMVTWVTSVSVVQNRTLVIAGYLYGLNTMFLTFRAFGHLMENTRNVGSIQIALFQILSDVGAIFWQFIAAILAFSIALTKVYTAEESYVPKDDGDKHPTCARSSIGFSCWWTMAKHLIWSLLGIVELDPFESASVTSGTVARFLYGAYLIMGVVLLINMLIALLSNTYQRVQDNSLKEWSFKNAIRIQTYSCCDPIPVPFNLLSSLVSGPRWILRWVRRSERKRTLKGRTQRSRMEQKMLHLKEESLDLVVRTLQVTYFATYGYRFPLTDKGKMDQVLQETSNLRQMTNQIAYTNFRTGVDPRPFPSGPKAWESEGVRIESNLLMYEGIETCQKCKGQPAASQRNHGARYLVPFSPECPHFEVLIIEAGERRGLEVGVARKNYRSHVIRGEGWKNDCVGYHIKGNIFDAIKATQIIEIDDAMADRGDLIGCTVMFEMAENDKVPIIFTLNGRPITQTNICVKFDQNDLLLFPFVSMGHEGVVVTAKMRSRDITGGFLSPVLTDGVASAAKDVPQTQPSATLECDITDVCRDLEYAGTRFRRIRDDILDNFKVNFRRLEDVFNDCNKQCLDLSNCILQKRAAQVKRSKQVLHRKITDALGGLTEIEEFGRTANSKFGKMLSELTLKSSGRC